MQITMETFYDPEDILRKTKDKIQTSKKNKEHIDYITIVPDGEPTLDENLGTTIKKLKELGYPIAVITNSSLLNHADVQQRLFDADFVSIKIDAIEEETWKAIDRPHGKLNYKEILQGIIDFSKRYRGSLCTETMLIKNVNDTVEELEKLSSFISIIKPKTSYLSVPTRPPAEPWVQQATEETLSHAYHLFTEKHIPTELLIGYEGNAFASTGDCEEDILSITAVHPMREDAVEEFLQKAHKDWNIIERLIREQKLVTHTLNDTRFYLRKLPKR